MSHAPTSRNADVRYDYYAIIPHPTAPHILMFPSATGWRLPHFERAERRFWQEVGHVNQILRDHLGIAVTVLRCVLIDYRPATEHVVKIYAMENHSPDWTPPDGRWVGRAELADLELAEPDHRTVIADWFAWSDAMETPLRPPWFAPGWFAAATDWIAAQLQRLGIAATGPVEQVRSWQRSAILRVATTAGHCYFKAVPPMFAHEPRLTAELAARNPQHFPAVLALDPARRWMLMQDVGGATLDQVREVERWEAALRDFARLQIAWVGQEERLIGLGCPDRRLARLAGQIDRLFADTAAMLPGRPAGLSAAEIDRLRGLAPRLRAMCSDLAGYNLPSSLEHGDFWAGQIVVNGDRSIFIDWSDSSLAHPFFSMLFFLVEIEDFFPRAPDVRTRLRDAYLQPWVRYAPMDRLVEAFELSQPLAALHHALIYHELVLPNMEIKWEMELMLPFYLKMLLRLSG